MNRCRWCKLWVDEITTVGDIDSYKIRNNIEPCPLDKKRAVDINPDLFYCSSFKYKEDIVKNKRVGIDWGKRNI